MKINFPAALVLALALACGVLSPARAGEPRYSGMVIDGNTGKVLYEAAADEPRHPASLTKMMTLYLVFEEMRRGRLNASTEIPISAHAAAAAPSKLGLEEGDTIAAMDGIKALITKSANDVAIAFAEYLAGSEPEFARRMTERAVKLGMKNTQFRNASGLPDPGQVTTARDMLVLALQLNDDFPDQFKLFSLRTFTYRGKTYANHNTLMNGFEGMDGIKTGYTRDSGFNVVTSVHAKGVHLVGAVFGGASAQSRNSQMRFLLRRALVDASTEKTRVRAPMLVAAPAEAPRPQGAPTGGWKAAIAATPKTAPAASAAEVPKPQPAKPRATAEAKAAAPKPAVETKVAAADPEPAATPAPRKANIEIVSVKTTPLGQAPKAAEKVAVATPAAVVASAGAPAASQRPAPAPAASKKSVAAKDTPKAIVPGRRPSTLNDQLAGMGGAPAPKPAQRPQGVAAVTTTSALGRSPSTLDAQAATLADNTPPEAPWHVGAPPAQAVPASASGLYDIEIGVFSSPEEADQRLANAGALSPTLGGATSLALPVAGSRPLVYRARFTGLAQAGAQSACSDLSRRAVACRILPSN